VPVYDQINSKLFENFDLPVGPVKTRKDSVGGTTEMVVMTARLYCSVLQCVAVCCSVLHCVIGTDLVASLKCFRMTVHHCCRVFECVAVCCWDKIGCTTEMFLMTMLLCCRVL